MGRTRVQSVWEPASAGPAALARGGGSAVADVDAPAREAARDVRRADQHPRREGRQRRPSGRFANIAFVAAMLLVCLLPAIWPGDAPWTNDEPHLLAAALDANSAHRPAAMGLYGSYGVPYGPLPTQIYQVLLLVTHNPVWLVGIRGVLTMSVTALALLWLAQHATAAEVVYPGGAGVAVPVALQPHAVGQHVRDPGRGPRVGGVRQFRRDRPAAVAPADRRVPDRAGVDPLHDCAAGRGRRRAPALAASARPVATPPWIGGGAGAGAGDERRVRRRGERPGAGMVATSGGRDGYRAASLCGVRRAIDLARRPGGSPKRPPFPIGQVA